MPPSVPVMRIAGRLRPALLRRDRWLQCRVDADIDHEEQRHDHARDDSRQEQFRYRGFGETAVDDHAEARRQQDAERAAGRERARRQRPVVVAAHELRQRDAADRRRRRNAGAAHRGEDRAARDVGLQQPAGQRRNQLGEAAIDARTQSADAQDLRHEHEQRHAGQHERIHAAPAHQAETLQGRQAALHQQVDDRRNRDRERHRHPGRQQAKE